MLSSPPEIELLPAESTEERLSAAYPEGLRMRRGRKGNEEKENIPLLPAVSVASSAIPVAVPMKSPVALATLNIPRIEKIIERNYYTEISDKHPKYKEFLTNKDLRYKSVTKKNINDPLRFFNITHIPQRLYAEYNIPILPLDQRKEERDFLSSQIQPLIELIVKLYKAQSKRRPEHYNEVFAILFRKEGKTPYQQGKSEFHKYQTLLNDIDLQLEVYNESIQRGGKRHKKTRRVHRRSTTIRHKRIRKRT
jgi:hypothetical protein